MSFSFEEKESVIDGEIKKRRQKWFLGPLTQIAFDDVSQIIKIHIYKKWHMWDQSKPLEPWLNRVISNQMKNLIRNNYGVFAKPCSSCPLNEGSCVESNSCLFTSNGIQSEECPLYKKWAKSKKTECAIKMPMSFDIHDFEIHSQTTGNEDLEAAAKIVHQKMKERLTEKQFFAYKMMYMKNMPEEAIAKKLGYKTSEKNRMAGYRQMKNLRALFLSMAKKIMEEEDVFYGG